MASREQVAAKVIAGEGCERNRGKIREEREKGESIPIRREGEVRNRIPKKEL